MTTTIMVCAVLEKLQHWFAEERYYSQLTTEDAKRNLDSLSRLKAIIKSAVVAESKYLQDQNFVKQVRQLRDILYNIEDLIESYEVAVAYRSIGGTTKNIFKRISKCKGDRIFRADLSSLIGQTSDLTILLEKSSVRDGLPESSTQGESSSPVHKLSRNLGRTNTRIGTVGVEHEENIIRMESDEAVLLEVLTRRSAEFKVISIVGMGGIGKTTLAKRLYNDTKVVFHFDIRAWVYVSDEFQTKEIFRSILHQVGGRAELMMSMDEMDLADQVYKCLKGRRWLVVLDDIWSIDAWESLKIAFPVSSGGATILITTRIKDLAVSMSGDAYIHQMSLLDDYQTWEWFKRKTQLGDTELNPKEEEIAKQILRKSCGLPLAIDVLANILRTKSLDEWKSMLHDFEMSGTQDFDSTTRVIDLSYDSLPSHLKPCLLYMGNFPEDSKFEVDTLCQLWIAEGLISKEDCRNEKTMMEVAAEYFDELAARSFVQVPEEEMSTHQRFSYGILHDLIRDFCISKAREEEFFEILMLERANQRRDSIFRYAIHLDKHGDMDILPFLAWKLRTLLFFNSYRSGEDLIHQRAIPDLSNLKWIRILHFDGVDFKGGKLPPGAGNLVLLRYLSFRDCYLEEVPSFISNFLSLLTLDLRVIKRCRVIVPNVLCKLEKLRHLYLPLKFQTPNHDKLQLDGMKELEILENFYTSTCSAGEIFKLTSFRKLVASAEGNLKDLEQILNCIQINADHMVSTSLDIRNFDCYSEERLSFMIKLFTCRVLRILRLEGRIGKMPSCSMSFTEIYLNGTQLEENPMQELGKLPNLRILVLEIEAYTGKKLHCEKCDFPELISLKLLKLYKLEQWEVEEGSMPKLSTLTIETCSRLKMLPEGLKYMKNLRKLKISMMPKEFVGRLQKVDGEGGEDLYKINSQCIIEFGSDNPWPESTDSANQQTNSSEGRLPEYEISNSTETPYWASNSAWPQQYELERDVYLQ